MFRRNISPPPSGISQARNQCESRWQAELSGFFLDLFFDLEDGGDMFLRNVG
jgi:hypothetical protein